MSMLLEPGAVYQKLDDFIKAREGRFGADARYHTCSAEGLDARGILDFLMQRGKVTFEAGRLVTAAGRMCSH